MKCPITPPIIPGWWRSGEPAVGVLITWPLSIPHQLVIELAKDTKVQILVEDMKSKQDAIKWLSKWGILPSRIRFITAPLGIDASWTRDWGPHAVFNWMATCFWRTQNTCMPHPSQECLVKIHCSFYTTTTSTKSNRQEFTKSILIISR